MRLLGSISVILVLLVLLAACGSLPQPVVEHRPAPAAGQAAQASGDALLVEAIDADRAVQAGTEAVFDFMVVNATGQPMPVVFALEHADGQRWRTSLCVDKQCLLGDGNAGNRKGRNGGTGQKKSHKNASLGWRMSR